MNTESTEPKKTVKQDVFAGLKRLLETHALSERERKIVEARFGITGGYTRTLEEVGKQFRVTRERIRQIEAKALRKLRELEHTKDAPMQKEEDPTMRKVIEFIETVGLNHSGSMGNVVIVEGGIRDPLKALSVEAFKDAITGGTGRLSAPEARQNVLAGRRALVAHVVSMLQELGGHLEKCELCHDVTVDEVHELTLDERNISIVLMPK